MTQLRTSEDIPYASSIVSLIRIRRGSIEFAKNKGEKQAFVAERRPSDKFIAAWTGKWATDIFDVDINALREDLG